MKEEDNFEKDLVLEIEISFRHDYANKNKRYAKWMKLKRNLTELPKKKKSNIF